MWIHWLSLLVHHGAYKFKPEQCTKDESGVLVPLRFDILKRSRRGFRLPIVLHGASSVLPEYVKIINENGGKLKAAVGIPAEQFRGRQNLLSARSISILTAGW